MFDKDKNVTFKGKFNSLEVKIEILDCLLKGEKASHIVKSLNLNEATVWTIKKNKKEKSAYAAGSSISTKYAACPRATIVERMEKALSILTDDNCQKEFHWMVILNKKHLKSTNTLKNRETAVNPDFVASKGWFQKFKKHFAIHSIKIQGESTSAKAGRKCPEKYQNIIEEQGYNTRDSFQY